MTKNERSVFVGELLGSIAIEYAQNSDRVPENWDGIELRMYVAQLASQRVLKTLASRKREYENDLTIHRL